MAAKKKKTDGVDAIVKLRAAAVSVMGDRLKAYFNRIENKISEISTKSIRAYHELGVLCLALEREADSYTGENGEPGLTLVSKAIKTQSQTIKKAINFARVYNDQQLADLVSRTHPVTGFRLTWRHVIYLLHVHEASRRQALEIETVNKMLDPAALSSLIQKTAEPTTRPANGRTHEMPSSLTGQLAQMLKICKQFIGKQEQVWDGEVSVFGNVLATGPDEIQPEHLSYLQDIRAAMSLVASYAASNDNWMDTCLRHVEQQLAAQQVVATQEMVAEATSVTSTMRSEPAGRVLEPV